MNKPFTFLTVAATILLSGCAVRQNSAPVLPTQTTQTEKFWVGCTQTTPIVEDGFQHFVCVDKHGRKHEILERLQPK